MKLTTLALCALGLAGLCSTQAVGPTTLLTSASCIDHNICADPPTRRNSYTFHQTSTPWTTSTATPSTGSNGYGYPIATHTICAADHCTTSVDCGSVDSTAVWWPAATTPCTTVDAAGPACTAASAGAYSCMPVGRAASSTQDYGGRSQRWVARLAGATSKMSEGCTTTKGATSTTKVPWSHSWVPAPTHCYSCIRPSSKSSSGFLTASSTVMEEVTLRTATTTKVPWTHSWVPAPTHCYSCIRPSTKSSSGFSTTSVNTTQVPWSHSWVPAPTHCYSCIRPSSRSSTTSSAAQWRVTPLAE